MNNKLFTLFLPAILLFLQCSVDPIAGGSDNPDFNVIGRIIDTLGNPEPNTQVYLVPVSYNPVTDQPVPDSLTDTTDASGLFHFVLPKKGVFNIEAVHLTQRKRLLITNVDLQFDSTIVAPAILQNSGSVKIFLPDTVDTAKGYVYIEGTTLYKDLSYTFLDSLNGIYTFLDSIPAAYLPPVYFGNIDDPAISILLIDSLASSPGDTAIIDLLNEWIQFTSNNTGLPYNLVNDIIINNNSFWFATNAGIARVQNDSWTVFTTRNSNLPSDTIFDITVPQSNTLWAATTGGIAYYNNVQWESYTTGNSGIPSDHITCIHEDSNQDKWFGTIDVGLVRFDGNTWTVFDTGNTIIPSNTISSFALDINDTVWCLTPKGVWKFKHSYAFIISQSDSLENFSIAIDRNRHKWIGHFGRVDRYDKGFTIIAVYNTTHSPLLSDSVLTIAEDNDGNMWFGTSEGLTMYDGSEWHDFTGKRYTMLEGKGVRAIAFDNKDNKWIGTTNNGVIGFGPTIE